MIHILTLPGKEDMPVHEIVIPPGQEMQWVGHACLDAVEAADEKLADAARRAKTARDNLTYQATIDADARVAGDLSKDQLAGSRILLTTVLRRMLRSTARLRYGSQEQNAVALDRAIIDGGAAARLKGAMSFAGGLIEDLDARNRAQVNPDNQCRAIVRGELASMAAEFIGARLKLVAAAEHPLLFWRQSNFINQHLGFFSLEEPDDYIDHAMHYSADFRHPFEEIIWIGRRAS